MVITKQKLLLLFQVNLLPEMACAFSSFFLAKLVQNTEYKAVTRFEFVGFGH